MLCFGIDLFGCVLVLVVIFWVLGGLWLWLCRFMWYFVGYVLACYCLGLVGTVVVMFAGAIAF